MSIPEQFSDLFDRMKALYLANTSMLWSNQAVEEVIAALSDAEVRDIVIELRGLGVTFWAHDTTTEPRGELSARILALPPGSSWSAMMPLNLDMSTAYLRMQISYFFGHFVDYDDEIAYEGKQRRPSYQHSRVSMYPFGEPELPFGLPGYNC